jgi:hypothetical protein
MIPVEKPYLQCRINPPVIDLEYPDEFGRWPMVFGNGWCGKFEQKKIKSNSEKQS